ncbi:MAG: SPASM domain-containing protein [Deltaproteobacteria bacterium]|nr:SPASM domain-containing protein [Deltaproteobacteria bacterium]
MPTWKVIDILDQAQAMGFNGRAAFHHYCEPLLDQRNLLFAKEAKERGMKPYLVTNGDRLHGDERLRQEVQHLYERIVVGIYDYETNEKLEEAKQYWKRMLPSADVDFSTIRLGGEGTVTSIGTPRALVPSDRRMAVPDLTYTNAPCHRPLVRMIIQYDGDVCNCCDDTFGAFQLGNVYQNTLAEIWFSREHRQILDDLVSGRREKYELCRGCPQGPTGPAPEGKKIGISIRRYQGSGAPQ